LDLSFWRASLFSSTIRVKPGTFSPEFNPVPQTRAKLQTPPNPNRDMKHAITLKSMLAGLAVLAGLQLASAQTIPPSLAAPPGSVNTNVPGFKMRIVQGNSSTPQTAAAPAEALIS